MRRFLFVLFALATTKIFCGSSDTMEVHCTVADINELSVDLSVIPILDIVSIPSGQLFATVTDTSSTYQYTTNNDNKKITATINESMPGLTTLEIELAASAGKGTSTGAQLLTTTASNVVTSINNGVQPTGQQITYTFTVILGADPFSLLTRVVTLSLIDE